MDQRALRDRLSFVGKGGKSKGKGYTSKGLDSPKGGWDNSKGSKGKGKWGKEPKGDGNGSPGKGRKGFNGNCHNCGVRGHRAYDCPEPKKQQHGVRYVYDQYQSSYQNAQQVAFIVTDLEGAQVDYRQQWSKVGKSDFKPPKAIELTEKDNIMHNKFEV